MPMYVRLSLLLLVTDVVYVSLFVCFIFLFAHSCLLIHDALRSAFSSQSRRGEQEVLVGPKCLPTGLPPSITPSRVSESLTAELQKHPDALEASFGVAQAMAKTSHLGLLVGHNNLELANFLAQICTRRS